VRIDIEPRRDERPAPLPIDVEMATSDGLPCRPPRRRF
jgi:hypothetical protein